MFFCFFGAVLLHVCVERYICGIGDECTKYEIYVHPLLFEFRTSGITISAAVCLSCCLTSLPSIFHDGNVPRSKHTFPHSAYLPPYQPLPTSTYVCIGHDSSYHTDRPGKGNGKGKSGSASQLIAPTNPIDIMHEAYVCIIYTCVCICRLTPRKEGGVALGLLGWDGVRAMALGRVCGGGASEWLLW